MAGHVGVGAECNAAVNAAHTSTARLPQGQRQALLHPGNTSLVVCWTPFAPASALGSTNLWAPTALQACAWGLRAASSSTPFSLLGPRSTDCRLQGVELTADLLPPGTLLPGQAYLVDVWAYVKVDDGGVPDAAGTSAPFLVLSPDVVGSGAGVPVGKAAISTLRWGLAKDGGLLQAAPPLNSYCGTPCFHCLPL